MARSSTRSQPARATSPIKFSGYSFEELLEIKKRIDTEVESRKAKEVENLRAKVTETAQSLGVSVQELFGLRSRSRPNGGRKTKHLRGPQPPKYRGPNGELWSGKGPAPKWMKPYLAKGKTKADFLIK
jgi:DNA-binding protein H-NS